MNLENLFEIICQATYKDGHDYHDYRIVYSQAEKDALWGAIHKWTTTEMSSVETNKRLAELEAKCYAYEQIIANSNFSPMLVNTKNTKVESEDKVNCDEQDCCNCINHNDCEYEPDGK